MKHRLILIVAATALAGLINGCAHTSAAHKPRVPRGPADVLFNGNIDRIDLTENTITVQHWPLFKTFTVGPDTDIEIPSRETPGALTDLNEGDPVIVTYQGNDHIPAARRIVRRSRAYKEEKEEQYERLQEMLYPSPNQ